MNVLNVKYDFNQIPLDAKVILCPRGEFVLEAT